MELYNPDQIIYVTDKRQELHFEQVFRAARKTKLVKEDTILNHIGYGTMNGKDGKPFKTREGGVMRLEYLIDSVTEEVYNKIKKIVVWIKMRPRMLLIRWNCVLKIR